MELYLDPNKRHDVYDVTNGNPNGDPDAGICRVSTLN